MFILLALCFLLLHAYIFACMRSDGAFTTLRTFAFCAIIIALYESTDKHVERRNCEQKQDASDRFTCILKVRLYIALISLHDYPVCFLYTNCRCVVPTVQMAQHSVPATVPMESLLGAPAVHVCAWSSCGEGTYCLSLYCNAGTSPSGSCSRDLQRCRFGPV